MEVFDYLRATSRKGIAVIFAGVFALLGAVQYVTAAAIALQWWGWILLALLALSVAQFLVWRDLKRSKPTDPIEADDHQERQKYRRKLLNDGMDLLHEHQSVGEGPAMSGMTAPFLKDKRYVHLRPFLDHATVRRYESVRGLGEDPVTIVTSAVTGISGNQHLRSLAADLERLRNEWNL